MFVTDCHFDIAEVAAVSATVIKLLVKSGDQFPMLANISSVRTNEHERIEYGRARLGVFLALVHPDHYVCSCSRRCVP